jgi:hypothetical protein
MLAGIAILLLASLLFSGHWIWVLAILFIAYMLRE